MNPFVTFKADQTLRAIGATSAPVDLNLVVQCLDLQLRIEFFAGDLSGVLMRKNGKGIIAVNATDAPMRQRFTIAHEIGHYVLEHKGDVFVDHTIMNRRDGRSSAAIDAQEIEANAFAAELLMPRSMVLDETNRLLSSSDVHSDQTSTIKALSLKFQVSEQAMTFRLMNLGLIA